MVAVDGDANAAQHANRDYEQIAAEILAEADAVDRAEDERYGDARGDELLPHLATEHGLIAALGVLDDLTLSQASAVITFRHASPADGARELCRGR